MTQPASIFISYRRSDTGGHAGRLFDRLQQWFDADALFYDAANIDSGDHFPEHLRAAVDGAKVVLVLIGPDWLAEINRRAGLAAVDFVRVEVESALRRQAAEPNPKVIPLLLGGAKPVALGELHETLRSGLERLPSLDAHEFQGKHADWKRQFEHLRGLMAAVPGVPEPRYRAPAGVPRPFRVIGHTVSPHFRDPRGALAEVRKRLQAGGRAAIVVPAALYGMGGVGKTQLALKYTYEYRDNYAGVWWFRAESENTLQLDARDACSEARVAVVEREAPMAAFTRWLEGQSEPWLIVFDNSESAAALRPCLPRSGPHHVLITSRSPPWAGVAQPVELAVWSDEEGAEFLTSRLPTAAPHDFPRLTRALGGLQLALEQAGAYLERTRASVADYCEQIENVDTAALILDEGGASTGYERSVLATLSVAFPRLTPAAQKLLRICAFFGAEPIPERYFRESADALPEAVSGAARETLAWDRAVGELRAYGIVERSLIMSLDREPGRPTDEKEQALVLHRLTLEVARHAVAVKDADGPLAQRLLRAQCPRDAHAPGQWPRFAMLLPHVLNLERLRPQGWVDRRAHAWMLDRAATYLNRGAALYGESKRLFELALNLDKGDLGDGHPGTLASMNNLALTLGAQGDHPGARALQEQVLSISRRVSGEEHPATLTSMNNLASTLGAQGDHPGARALQEQVLSIRRRVLGEEHPATLTSMNNLAGTLGAQGDHPGARALEEQVLSIRRRVLGEEHPDTLTSMNNLASTLGAQGDHPGARALQEQVLSIRRRVLGEEHPDTLTSMNNLALTLGAQGDHPGARALQEQVLSIRRRVLGEEHPDTLTSMNNLASTLGAQGDHPGARALEEQVLSIRRRVLGEEHPATLTSMSNLAGTLGAQGDHPGARALQEQVLSIRRRVLGEEHPDTLTSMSNLAGTLGAQGDHPGARALQEQVLSIRRRVLGEEHPATLASMNNLAGTLGEQGDHPGARALQEQVLSISRRVLGEEHPDTLTSMNNLAGTLGDQGDHPGARALEEQVLSIRRRVLGEEHPATLTSMNNLASTLGAQGDHPGARALQEQVLSIRRRVLGEEHPATLTSMNNLAITMWSLGERSDAIRLMEEAAEGFLAKLGNDHPHTNAAQRALEAMRAAAAPTPRGR